MRELRCVGSERLLRRGVSMAHLHLISMLERHGELPMSRIAEVLDVSVSSATGLVDRIEERGFVERIRVADDRRVVLVRLTAAGRQILADAEGVQDDLVARVLERLEDGQLDRLAASLDDIRAVVAAIRAEQPELVAHQHEPYRAGHPAAAGAAR